MAHPQQQEFIKKVKGLYPDYFKNKTVLEFGSLNLNGTVRDFFEGCDYTGVDIVEGDGVDIVSRCHEYIPDKDADVVISCEMLEHDKDYSSSIQHMIFNLNQGGLLIITAATLGRQEHGTLQSSPADSPATNDYYRNISMLDVAYALRTCFSLNLFDVFHMEINRESHDIYLYAIKKIYE